MPRLTRAVPRCREPQGHGKAIISICGRGLCLGPYRSRASKVEYDRLIAEWLAGDRQPTLAEDERASITVAELIVRYWKWAQQHYRRDGKPTETLVWGTGALRVFRKLCGHTRAADFGPRAQEV